MIRTTATPLHPVAEANPGQWVAAKAPLVGQEVFAYGKPLIYADAPMLPCGIRIVAVQRDESVYLECLYTEPAFGRAPHWFRNSYKDVPSAFAAAQLWLANVQASRSEVTV